MQLIYTHENPMIVSNAQNLLEQVGIATHLKNEFSSGGLGELSAFDTWPEIWVMNDKDVAQAKKIIAELLITKQPKVQSNPEWICKNCSETNDASFEFCWNCQEENPSNSQ